MLDCCAKSLPLLRSLVRHSKQEYGSFELSSIPAIEIGCRYWAALNDTDKLRLVAETIRQVPEVQTGWQEIVDSALEDAALAVQIQDYVSRNPGALQSKMGKLLGVSGRDTGRLINTLVKCGRIMRTQAGTTYELRCVGAVEREKR
jgi:hypothetical protein